ncbi:MAG TPA: hypothetical protein VFE51_25130 [Verrucomicrobiae bacterium]|nr:hypothetical protein [Verrucomicrobiae bacterium]
MNAKEREWPERTTQTREQDEQAVCVSSNPLHFAPTGERLVTADDQVITFGTPGVLNKAIVEPFNQSYARQV